MAEATIKQVMEFFGYTSTSSFMAEWKALDTKSKDQLRAGVGDKSLNY